MNRSHGQLNLFLSVIRFIAGIDNVKVILILISGVVLTFHLQWPFKNVKGFSLYDTCTIRLKREKRMHVTILVLIDTRKIKMHRLILFLNIYKCI